MGVWQHEMKWKDINVHRGPKYVKGTGEYNLPKNCDRSSEVFSKENKRKKENLELEEQEVKPYLSQGTDNK